MFVSPIPEESPISSDKSPSEIGSTGTYISPTMADNDIATLDEFEEPDKDEVSDIFDTDEMNEILTLIKSFRDLSVDKELDWPKVYYRISYGLGGFNNY
jgi:hypothetical protein